MYLSVTIPFSGIPQAPSIPFLEGKEYTELIMHLQENIRAIFTPYFHINLQAFLSNRINHSLTYMRTYT